jgi:hypothetical protein
MFLSFPSIKAVRLAAALFCATPFLFVAGCGSTYSGKISPQEMQNFKLDRVEVVFLPSAIQFDAKARKPIPSIEQVQKSIRSRIDEKIQASLEPALVGDRKIIVRVTVRSLNVPFLFAQPLSSDQNSLGAEIEVVDSASQSVLDKRTYLLRVKGDTFQTTNIDFAYTLDNQINSLVQLLSGGARSWLAPQRRS